MSNENINVRAESTVVVVSVRCEVTRNSIPVVLTQEEALQLIAELNEAVTKARS